MSFHVPENYRVRGGLAGSGPADGNNGAFWIPGNPRRPLRARLYVIASDGEGWEHVSVSLHGRCPTWSEMQRVRSMFWSPGDTVMQLHPPESEYVNVHPWCLHLWRPIGIEIPRPPSRLVG